MAFLLHVLTTASGPKRRFAAAQQTVALGGIATSQLSAPPSSVTFFGIALIDATTIVSDNSPYRN
jgi:hypothetical protein